MTAESGGSNIKEHIWMVALFEKEARATELLERLSKIGIDTSEATTVRVEVDENQRKSLSEIPDSSLPLSTTVRNGVSGALLGAALALFAGIFLYASGLFIIHGIEGMFNHAVVFVLTGGLIGFAAGLIFSATMKKRPAKIPVSEINRLKSAGYLVAVKMPPNLAERAEGIARGLGAKEILL